MAITNAQQARQLYRFGGDTMGGPNDKSTSGPGPDDRSSAEQTMNTRAAIRDAQRSNVGKVTNTIGDAMLLRNIINFNPMGIMKNIGSKVILDKLTKVNPEEDENMQVADVSAADINRLLGTNPYGKQKYAPNQDIETIRTIEGPFLNPTITDEEIEDVLKGTITEPTGQFAADGGRIGFRGGDAAKSDAASGRDAGRADPGGGVDDRSDAGQTAVNNAAIMMARMQNQNLNKIKNPNLIEKFPGGVRAIDRINLDRMIADMNLNTIKEEEDEDTNAIDTVFSPDIAPNVQTIFGTGLSDRQQIEKNILDSMADGGRAGLAEGGMPYEGGIMDLESARQMYGLGKLVKKVTRSVKKIAKSPIGKAALLYAGTAGLGALGAGSAGTGFKLFGSKSFLAPSNVFSNLMTSGRNLGLLKRLTNTADGIGLGVPKRIGPLSNLGVGSLITGASAIAGLLTKEQEEEAQALSDNTGFSIEEARNSILARARDDYKMDFRARGFRAEGGPAEGKEPVAKKTMPLLDMGGKEMDLRAEGGFVPIGRMEKADDVPARLSKNEFVFTADAVRNAGEGDVDKGAEVMYNMMKNLESGGEVSEESQGLEGARKMFQTSQRLEEVL